MKLRKNLSLVLAALLLAVCAAGYYWTRETAAPRPAGKQTAQLPSLIDDRLLRTARRVAALAETADEQEQATEALRLVDHELDQSFVTALREAQAVGAAAAPSPVQQQLAARIAELKTKVASGGPQVAQLAAQAAANPAVFEQLQFASAQLALDQDDLEDAQQDLARQGDDRHTLLERARQQHETAEQGAAPLPRLTTPPAPETMREQVRQWFALNGKRSAIAAAQQQAAARAASMDREHDGLESRTAATPSNSAAANSEEEDTAAVVARLRKLADGKKTLTELDKRIQDAQQLAAAYQTWAAILDVRQRAVLHLLLRSLGIILGIVLLLVVAYRITMHVFRAKERRKRYQVQVAVAIGCQFIAVISILLIAFGLPTQLSTILGLATAGLTVVLKDFIVGFIGWFVLMGRNGVRIGDWVEINGVGGEIIEIGVLKTVMLEMGNWTNTGHPTGRRVSFSNSYAIEGHYFNFSTVGQWLWDELQVTLPAGGDPYQKAEQIRQIVERETAAASTEAAQDWERVTHQYGVTTFSAKPAVDLRPGANGLDVIVRYITRAPLRYEVKSRLFQAIIGLMQAKSEA